MNEEVHLLEPADQFWQPLPARPLHIGPAGPQILGDCYADLVMQSRIYGREIDTPQMTVPVAMEGLKDDPAGKPVSYSCFHNSLGTQVRHKAPDGHGLRRIPVVPPAVRGQAHM
jgi:hypothetical protein